MEIQKTDNQLKSANLLDTISLSLKGLDTAFRDELCKECGWSEATYYRKKKDEIFFSPVEKKAIRNTVEQMLKNVNEALVKAYSVRVNRIK